MRLQTSKQSSVVMLEVKVLQPQFGVFDGDLVEIEVLRSDLLISQTQISLHSHWKPQNEIRGLSSSPFIYFFNPRTSVLSLWRTENLTYKHCQLILVSSSHKKPFPVFPKFKSSKQTCHSNTLLRLMKTFRVNREAESGALHKAHQYLSVLLWHHVKVWLLISSNWRLWNLVIAVILQLHLLYLIRNLTNTHRAFLNARYTVGEVSIGRINLFFFRPPL